MNFGFQPQTVQNSYGQYQPLTNRGIQLPPQPYNNENISWKPQLQVPMHRHNPSVQSLRQFGRQLQNIPQFAHPAFQSDSMDIDEIGHQYKPHRGSSTNLIRDRSQSSKRLQQIRENIPKFGGPTQNQQISQNVVKTQQELVHKYYSDKKGGNEVQSCTEYQDDINSFLVEVEKLQRVNPSYMAHQVEINDKMRAILIDWLIEVHLKFKLQPETLFITINIIDRYLEKEKVSKSRLQLVGVTALLIASKYEEIYPPELKDFVYITDRAYSKQDVLSMEFSILNVLSFDLTFPTAFRFLEKFSKKLNADDHLVTYACFLLELSLVDIRMLQYLPSVIAASTLTLAFNLRNKLGIQNDGRTEHKLIMEMGMSPKQLEVCQKELQYLHVGSAKSSLQAVRKKYQKARYAGAHTYIMSQM